MNSNGQNPSILDHFNEYSGEYFNKLLMSKTHISKYREAMDRRYSASEMIRDELLKDTSPVQDYLDAIDDVTCLDFEYLYCQGLRDCIMLLRALGLIPNGG